MTARRSRAGDPATVNGPGDRERPLGPGTPPRPTYVRDRGLLEGKDLTRYRNQPDKSLHQSGAAMHHRPEDQERALNLSILTAS